MVQAAVDVDVNAAVEELAQPGGVLEVQLVDDKPFEAWLVEQVEERGVRLLARMVERVLVRGGATLDKHPGKREVTALDRIEQCAPLAFAAPKAAPNCSVE